MNTNYWLNKVMDTMYGGGATEFWLGLSSTQPTGTGSGVTEPVGNNYSRVKIAAFTASVDGVVKNMYALHFPKSSGVWFPSDAKAAYWLLFDGDGETANLLSSGMLLEAKTVEGDTVITIPEETLSIALTDYSSAIV